MARYYLDKDLTITGIVPGSMVGVWYDIKPITPSSDLLRNRCEELFVGRVNSDTLTIPMSNREGVLFIRVRKEYFRTFETPFYLNGSEGVVSVRQRRD